jgi:hypothetical protein
MTRDGWRLANGAVWIRTQERWVVTGDGEQRGSRVWLVGWLAAARRVEAEARGDDRDSGAGGRGLGVGSEPVRL